MNPPPLLDCTTVAIVEDDADISDEIQHVLDEQAKIACACVCRSVRSALEMIPIHRPNVVIMDLSLPDGSGAECTRWLKELMPELHVLIFSVHEDDDAVFEALRAGASGYLLKTSAPEELVRAITGARTGDAFISPSIAGKIVRSFRQPVRSAGCVNRLTEREQEVLDLFSKCLLPKDVAGRMHIEVGTLNTHLKHIYEKLSVRSRTEAVLKYLGR